MSMSRRGFIKAVSASMVASSLIACQSDDTQFKPITFEHGVASGDPLQDAVIIWTRVTTESRYAEVTWQLSEHEDFAHLVASGKRQTDSEKDFTVKVDVIGLAAGKNYFYRFICQGINSQVGRTKTLAQGELAKASLAVVSCSNYPTGYFNVYREIVLQHQKKPFDAVLHLGDYIYEYGSGGYATENAASLGREPSRGTECVSLQDYRARYAQYRQDSDLQALHASMPMIAVWDDHEIANDTWLNGAENHQPEQGSFELRRAAAAAAWVEWLPVRENPESNVIIYRHFSFGDLLDLYMLDTRVVARDEPLDYFSLSSPSMEGIAGLVAQSRQPGRNLLGQHQKQWLKNQMANASGKWSIMGQQVLMSRMELPSTVMQALFGLFMADDENKALALNHVNQAIQTYLANPNSDPHLIPYNLDAWDGYYQEREWLYHLAQQEGKRFISLAGDSHNAWCSQLFDAQGKAIGIEFATSSVSSPGLEEYLGVDGSTIMQMEHVLPLLVRELQWTDLKQRGFLRLDVTKEKAEATWTFISNIMTKDYQVKQKTIATEDGKGISIR
ncbi:alkaline phosphatase D family protein [Vibrio metschnikovii]|uniref:alkaline phosphatase D family protein n=1 Tax=Vibrio metschnikovii TaxID=28172 RepID=UPI001C30A4FD|nr:alkaline phosphatase D family protein [Vibrio metschnikovii]